MYKTNDPRLPNSCHKHIMFATIIGTIVSCCPLQTYIYTHIHVTYLADVREYLIIMVCPTGKLAT